MAREIVMAPGQLTREEDKLFTKEVEHESKDVK